MSGLLVLRLRSDINVRQDIVDTMHMLNLNRVNHATIVPDNDVYRGMLQKAKDYLTFGSVTAETITTLLTERGETQGGGKLTDAVLAAGSSYKTIGDYAAALAEGRDRLGIRKPVEGSKTRKTWVVKPILRLQPPVKGHEGIKHSHRVGGALGPRKDGIDALVGRMV